MKNIVIALIILLFTAIQGFAEIFELDFDRLESGRYILTYEEHYYDGVGESFLTIQRYKDGYHVVWNGIIENSEVYTDINFNTYKMIFSDKDTSLTIERFGNILKVSGQDEGKVIEKELSIKADNWFQILSFSLIPFVMSGNTRINFALFDPYNIKVRKMRIDKDGEEKISIFGEDYQSVKMSMRMEGFFTSFWKSELWNSVENGLHLKYEGINVIPTFYNAKNLLKGVIFKN